VCVRQEILHRIPENISFQEAALTEPFCVVYHALARRITINRGDTVAVIGPGPIGLIALQTAKILGAGKTVLVGINRDFERLELAAKQGWADRIINAEEKHVSSEIKDLTQDRGADVVADCAGNSNALALAMKTVRRGGSIVKIGWGPEPFNHTLDPLLKKSVTLAGTFGHNKEDWEAVLELMEQKKLKPKPLISAVMLLSEWRSAFEQIESCRAVKIVLTPE
jgi:alcohol dehydrogenase/L-iditol 2-dehydrogenase